MPSTTEPTEGDTREGMNPLCSCGSGLPVVCEIEGRVLACQRCVDDDGLREHAKEDWR